MILLSVAGVRKHFGPEPVLAGVTFEVRSGERIGLVGPNGSGKTTLLRILAGKDEADAGTCRLRPSLAAAYLEQRPLLAPGRTLWDEARSALASLIALLEEMVEAARAISHTADEAERRRLTARYDHLQQELDRRGGYHLDHRIERVLDGLGFRQETYRQPVESLSGGEQNRLMLAKLLLAEPDLMLLDEPSNHLDIEATEWLEEFLAKSRAAMILVSHDRYFLDTVTNRTVELFHGTVESYAGNYSAYYRQKAERLLVQRRAYQKQQVEIEKAREFIRRNAYGQKHAQAEDRRKKLARIEPVDPPREIDAPVMGFPPAARSGDIVLRVEHLSKAYEQPLFEDVSFDVTRGQRWGVLGPNGSGKTTLVRCLIGQIEPDAGRVIVGHGVRVGYFDQHLTILADHVDVVDAIRPDRKDFDERKRRGLLARFGLTGDMAFQGAASLSGGERCRAGLALLCAAEANLLVLDEPTNHLDLWARQALERSLKAFDGTVLFVSHDRYFVDQVADHLLVIEPPGRLRVVEGNYATYQHLVGRGLAGAPGELGSDEPAGGSYQECPRADNASAEKRDSRGTGETAPRRKRRFPYRKVDDLEREIFEREARVEQIYAALADPETLRDGEQVRELKAEIADQQQTLETLYEHWEEATELNW
ncbi:MAG TPA: ABC-F family ATP-binding cassette domain-containing protein [Thermoguttaceae bacterium]|nr:ABC-F family ATP-binding cassette domain-containing protein [Thermoguttaceae bacterium]